MGKSYMEGVSLLEILIWVSPNKSGICIPFCLQSQNSTSYHNLNLFYMGMKIQDFISQKQNMTPIPCNEGMRGSSFSWASF
jgi:hypothetical protein